MSVEPPALTRPVEAAAAAIRKRWATAPLAGLVLGSGLGDLAEAVEAPQVLPFEAIPHHPRATVAGHAGAVYLGTLEGVPVAVWRGRVHYYEGRSMAEVAFPIRLLRQLGARAVVLTNAAGGLAPDLRAGDLMLIEDHVNLPGLVGHSPLHGPHEPALGERFVELSQAYDPELRALARRVAAEQGLAIREGVYAMVGGPNYETPAEGRLLRQFGADAVGMSTAPEVVVARQCGLRVLAISAITNAVLALGGAGTTHQEVLAAAERLKPAFSALVRGVVRGLPAVLAP